MNEVIAALQGVNIVLLGIGVRKLFDIVDTIGELKKEVEGIKMWTASHEKQDDERWELMTKDFHLHKREEE